MSAVPASHFSPMPRDTGEVAIRTAVAVLLANVKGEYNRLCLVDDLEDLASDSRADEAEVLRTIASQVRRLVRM
ncbi:hypothetical protein [Haematobacter missouriensis]|nr:hypothetical protein [Haematobacter missouriensis]